MTFPLDEVYIAFGDGSVTAAGAAYGLVLIPERVIQPAEDMIASIKQKFGGAKDSTLHCRELFRGHERKKAGWSHLSDVDSAALCGEILRELSKIEVKYLLGYIPSASYPRRFRLNGKKGFADVTHKVDEKWLMLWAYFRIAALLDPVDIDQPADPSITPRARNLPFWQMRIKRTDPGFRVRKIFLDREQTHVRWFSKTFQWTTIAKELVIENTRGQSYLPVDSESSGKHRLLDIADVFVYSLARSLTPGRQLKCTNLPEAHIEAFGAPGEEWVVG